MDAVYAATLFGIFACFKFQLAALFRAAVTLPNHSCTQSAFSEKVLLLVNKLACES